MANAEKRPLKVFLCHASGDKPYVRDLYKRLTVEGVNAWLDQEKLLPGQDWRMEIPRAVREADVVVICLSKKSITKEGYVQKEIKFALDIAEEKPEGTIFLIPARLEDCVVPERLNRWQWVDLYDENGFIKLLRSLKIRADAMDATVEPTSYIDTEQETDRKLEQLYTEGLAAFYTEDWDKACQRFQTILSERPNHKNASEKLEESERQRNLSKLYEQATGAARTEDWIVAIQTLDELSQKSASYKDVAQLLKNARKQKQLNEFYIEAKTLHAAQKWEAVVKVFDQIVSVDPNYTDTERLLPSAQKEVVELQRLAELNDQYSHALREMDSGNWYEARRLLETVHKSQTGYLETEQLLKKVEDEIVREEEKRKQNDQINTLYEQAHGLLRSKKWRNALDKMEEIRKLDDHFPDVDEIAEKARKELTREEQEAERQNKLAALYAEAVKLLKEEEYQEALNKWGEVKTIDPKYPDRQRVQKTVKRKISSIAKRGTIPQLQLSAQNIKIEWFILLASIGFGLARQTSTIFNIPSEFGWSLRGVLHGIISLLILHMVIREWKWNSLLVFAICWAGIYPVTRIVVLEFSNQILPTIVYSIAPVLSIVISSWLARQKPQWTTYLLVFMGWLLAWTIGASAARYLLDGFEFKWIISDMLAGGIGLWITVDLLREKPADNNVDSNNMSQQGSAKILLLSFLSVLLIRAIWGATQNWLRIWDVELLTISQFIFISVLSALYGTVISFALSKVVPHWKVQHSLVVIIGWAFGFGIALLITQVGLEFVAGIMALGGISIVIALKWASPSMSPIKLTLIFISWALSWKYGNVLGGYLVNNLGSDYLHSFSDALIVMFGLLATLGIYEYSSNRLVKIMLLSTLGFALGNLAASVVFDLLALDHQVGTPLVLPIWGFIAGAVLEIPSRDLKKILIRGGLCAFGLLIGYFSGKFLLSRFMTLPNLLWGVGVGIALTISTRRMSIITLITILGAAIFMLTTNAISDINTTTLSGNIIRGAWIGLVLGFGYAYATRGLADNKIS